MKKAAVLLFGALVAALACGIPGFAMQPPEPGMIERMKQEGTYQAALDFALSLGTHELKTPRLGNLPPETDPAKLAELIAQHMGQSLDTQRGGKSLSSAAQAELNWMQLDLNHDRVIDERDLLALGYPRPKSSSAMPTVGNVKIFALLIDFEEYPAYYSPEEMQETMFGTGHESFYYKGLSEYYRIASYNQLNFDGIAYGWHRASQPRSYYHPNDNQDYSTDSARRNEVVMEAILAADAAGADFGQYDNDGDGSVDTFLVIWTGPHGDWSTFWWGYFGVALPGGFVVDGVNFTSYSWQWERYYGFTEGPPEPPAWDPLVTIHETGHALGLPDFYDYEPGNGPEGGVGRLDMMHGNWGDHGAFNKYVLGWLSPTIAYGNLDDHLMRATGLHPDAVVIMPGYDPVSPWQEYFIAQNRHRVGLDVTYPGDGILMWHVDARLNNGGNFAWNNSTSSHKLIRLMEADGNERIETGDGNADAGDYYNQGETFGPVTFPNSNRYSGSSTGITMNDISTPDGEFMTADFTLYSSNPPQVMITAPSGGDTITGTTTVEASATDDNGVSSLQLFIDGELVASSGSGSLSYTWNSLVDFNKPLNITARAWDGEGQSGSATTGVTVDNTGLAEISDIFTSSPAALIGWRVENYPLSRRGQNTDWTTRASPASPPRVGPGNEAFVRRINANGGNNMTNYPAEDGLRSSRLDIGSFTRPVQLQFQYRNRGGLSLWVTTDEGASWERLENLPATTSDGTNLWVQYNKVLNLSGNSAYFRFHYNGSVRTGANYHTANIANFLVRETPSDPPAAVFTSPADGAVLSGDMVFEVDATDDGTVERVEFYILGTLLHTDTEAPYSYTRDTSNDDNDPALLIRAVAVDDHGLQSVPAEITVALRNAKTWPFTDSFESGTGNWAISNDGRRPEWGNAPGQGREGSGAIGYFTATTWQTNNSDGILSSGPALEDGLRRSIDLGHPDAVSPVASYWYRGQMPNNWSLALYFYSTWRGYQHITDHAKDAADWEQRSVSLAPFVGQSGRFTFWVFGANSTSGGTAVYIDDFSIANEPPLLDALLPNAAYSGETVTLLGSSFGNSRGTGSVSFTGAVLEESDYLSWSNTAIQVLVPHGAESGPVFVTAGGIDSNTQPFAVSATEIGITGLLPDQPLYLGADEPLVQVAASTSIQRVELYVDGVLLAQNDSAPGFAGLRLPMAQVPNGSRSAWLVGYSANGSFSSAQLPFKVYSLPGDLNGDGVIDTGDAAALRPLLGLQEGDLGFEPWHDPDGDGVVSEADLSYIGYNFGQAIPAP